MAITLSIENVIQYIRNANPNHSFFVEAAQYICDELEKDKQTIERVKALPDKLRGHSYESIDESWNFPHKQGLIMAADAIVQELQGQDDE